jgi:hypothetical protein
MKRDTRSAYRARAAAAERSVDTAIAEVKAAEAAEAEERSAVYAERNKPVPFTAEELESARVVRTMYGWHRVIRVNAKTVTVSGDFGDYRVPSATVLEVRA